MTLIDSHAHYEHKLFTSDRNSLIKSMPDKGVELIINCGCDIPSTTASINLAEIYSNIYATAGIHPHEAKTASEKNLQKIKDFCNHKKVVALGETGLDFHYDFSPRDVQRYAFKRQLEIAHEVNLPVVIHSREANQEVFDTIKNSPIRNGVIHSFSGDAELAMAYVNLGFYIGIGGVVTFDKTGTLQDVATQVPLERILLETDAPYLTPAPKRGKRNESHYLFYVAEKIAELKNITVENVCEQTTKNVKNLFTKIK